MLLMLVQAYSIFYIAEALIDYLKPISEAAPKTPLVYYHIPSLTNVQSRCCFVLRIVSIKQYSKSNLPSPWAL